MAGGSPATEPMTPYNPMAKAKGKGGKGCGKGGKSC
jgi:hypothetical protein